MSEAAEPAKKGNADQVRARRAWVVEKTLAGYAQTDIAAALGVRVSTVAGDRQAMTRHLRGMTKKTWRSPRPAEPLEPFDWRNADPVVRDTTYTRMTPVRHVEAMLKSVQGENGLNRLAHNINAASRADDRKWLTNIRKTLVEASQYLDAMIEVVNDEEARTRAATTLESRDDLKAKGAPGQRRYLPEPGAGILPSPLYGYLWRYRYADRPLDDAELAEIANMLHYRSPLHIKNALEEFDAKYPMNNRVPGSQ